MEKGLSLNLRLKQAIEWLKSNKQMKQMDIAKKMGITEASFSRGIKRCEERVDSGFVIKFHQATGEIFSLDWLLHGVGDKFPGKEKQEERDQKAPMADLDFSSVMNALLAKSDEAIASLKREIVAKDEIIQSKDDRIADLTKLAEERLARIAELRRIIEANNINISAYPFPIGAAEDNKNKRKQI